jgi:hypothetical protein
MKKIFPRIIILLVLFCMISWTAYADPWLVWQPSEWDATGFNNARRFVRDSNGYFHAFWHSQKESTDKPCGANCNIYYCFTTRPASEPPPMAWQGAWSTPVNLTANLGNSDNRYPAADIEYENYTGVWHNYNRIHLVWQAVLPNGNRYEVLYASLSVGNPPRYPAPFSSAANLSNTPLTDSLVPAIAINKYLSASNQNLHVVWQEEDISDPLTPSPVDDTKFSDIAYIRSTSSGASWSGPAGGWFGHSWDNLTQSNFNSQMPAIACIPEQYTGTPGGRPGDLGCNSDDVHVSYNEDYGSAIFVYYLRSPNNGLSWNPRVNVSNKTGGGDCADAYSSLAVDLFDNPHLVFMRNLVYPREPLRTSVSYNYVAGLDPSLWWSYPGPQVGMYGFQYNGITYAYFDGGNWQSKTWYNQEEKDREFPTIALDRRQNVTVNWQEYSLTGLEYDYVIKRTMRINLTPPGYPLAPQVYLGWTEPVGEGGYILSDEIFPTQANRKAAMYECPIGTPNSNSGYDEMWNMMSGHGPSQAVSALKTIMQDGNVQYDTGL